MAVQYCEDCGGGLQIDRQQRSNSCGPHSRHASLSSSKGLQLLNLRNHCLSSSAITSPSAPSTQETGECLIASLEQCSPGGSDFWLVAPKKRKKVQQGCSAKFNLNIKSFVGPNHYRLVKTFILRSLLGPKIYLLPLHVTTSISLVSFKCSLKTYLFHLSDNDVQLLFS